MKIYLATDHAGFDLKESLKKFLTQEGHEVIDSGAHENNPQDDYPDFIIPGVEKMVADKGSVAIVMGGSGQGEALAANKVKGARAALYYGGPTDIITLSREHNGANVLSLGARFLSTEEAQEVVKLWLSHEEPKEERHLRRLKKITDYENRV